jgi:hypothetical protein
MSINDDKQVPIKFNMAYIFIVCRFENFWRNFAKLGNFGIAEKTNQYMCYITLDTPIFCFYVAYSSTQ